MKVLFVYSGNSISGQNKIVENQAKTIISNETGIDFFPIMGKGFKGYLKSVKGISQKLKEKKYDIVHAHYGLSGMVSFFAKKNERIVVSFMGDDLVGTNNYNGSIQLWSRILIQINAFYARFFYDHTIVKSSEMVSKLFRKTRYSLIPNGVRLEDFYSIPQSDARDQLGIEKDKTIVLFVSDTTRTEKNYPLAASAIRTCNNNNMILMAVSNLSVETLNLYYNATDLVLLTSYHEGSPNVIKEAMACGCPVVSTDVGDVRWLFGTIQGHYLISFNPFEIAEKIKLAVEYRKIFKYSEGRERIKSLGLSSDTVAAKIIEIYKKVLKITD